MTTSEWRDLSEWRGLSEWQGLSECRERPVDTESDWRRDARTNRS